MAVCSASNIGHSWFPNSRQNPIEALTQIPDADGLLIWSVRIISTFRDSALREYDDLETSLPLASTLDLAH